jgi:hypothetical protein
MQKVSKFDYVAEKGSNVRNYALQVSCSLAKIYLAVETQRADKKIWCGNSRWRDPTCVSLRTHFFPRLSTKTGIRYIPEALVLTDALLQNNDDEHLISPLLLPPWEDETNNKEGCLSRGGFKSVITHASWSHKSPTVRHKTHSFGSRLSIRYSSVLMFNV